MIPAPRLKLAMLVISTVAVAACATANTWIARGTEFTRFRTYDWAPSDRFETGDPRLDNNQFFTEAVQAAVEKRLAARGLERSSVSPNLLVHFHATIAQQIDVSAEQANGPLRTHVYEAGSLLIDFVDTASDTLVWRGWVDGNIDDAIDDQEWMERKVDQAVAEILEDFPPAFR
jgi:uncharacterized protein DUF4136